MVKQDRYTDWVEIGKGASATVFRVLDQSLQRHVAIKLLKANFQRHPTILASLKREVLISRDLRHPNICPVHDLYEGEKGVGIIMDLIDGMELKKWIKINAGKLLDTAGPRLTLFRKLAGALEVAHTHIVHRDLKPDNIFLLGGDPERPVIMDFGISTVGEGASGDISGTPKYMAPEQWLSPKDVDQRTDLFSLGMIAYELFTETISPTSLKNILKTKQPPRVPLGEIAPPSSFCPAFSPALDRIVIQLMGFEQADRPRTAAEVRKLLDQVELRDVDFSKLAAAKSGAADVPTLVVEGGEFYLGAGAGQDALSNEKPPRKVRINSFRMDQFPVTNRAYRAFLKATGYQAAPLMDDEQFGVDDHPVVGVSWDDAAAYAKWMGGMLPSEAQWEYAAKGGRKFPFYPWGDEEPSSVLANIGWVSQSTSPVESCPSGANPLGFHELCGNVWEWCRDVWSEEYYAGLKPGTEDPVYDGKGAERSQRGGSFNSMAGQGRCSYRSHASPGERRPDIGFRLVYPVDDA